MIAQTNTASSAPSGLTWLRGLGSAVVDLLFPPCCVACQRFGAWLCAECQAKIEVILPPLCSQCGMPLDAPAPSYSAPSLSESPRGVANAGAVGVVCHRCRRAAPRLDGLRTYAFHSDPLRLAIHQFKYEDLRSLAVPLGKLMGAGWKALAPPVGEVDVIVPVPLHPARKRERGYNQAALLARELADCLGRPVVEDVLIRTRATAPQTELNPQERRANVSGAFQCVNDGLAARRVLLIDDVYTTGATLEAACAALRDAGASSVWAFTLTRAKREGVPALNQSLGRRVENGTDHQG